MLDLQRTNELVEEIAIRDGEGVAVRDGAVIIYDHTDKPAWLPPDADEARIEEQLREGAEQRAADMKDARERAGIGYLDR